MRDWFRVPAAAHLMLTRDREVLLLLRAGTGYEDGRYSVVAGHLDGDEPASAAMVREAAEEAGIVIRGEWLRLGCVMHRRAPDRESVDFFFECTRWDGEVRNREPHKCAGLRFFPADDLPPNTVEYVRAGIRAARAGVRYVEFGWGAAGLE